MGTQRLVVRAFLVLSALAFLQQYGGAQVSFWDSYLAGKAANESGDYAKAIASLEAAVAQRPASAKRVRLYGTNFASGYYPYTELGLAYLKAGNPAKAKVNLQKALADGVEPKDRAQELLARATESLRNPPAPQPAPTQEKHAQAPSTSAEPVPPPARAADARLDPLPPSSSSPSPPSASVRFSTEPKGARVLLDGKAVGITPLDIDIPGKGEHRVAFTLSGHRAQERNFTVQPGEAFTVSATLVPQTEGQPPSPSPPLPSTGDLLLRVAPLGTSVALDGTPRGTILGEGMVLTDLPPGDHHLSLALTGHESVETTVRIQPGIQSFFEFRLKAIPVEGPPRSGAAGGDIPGWAWASGVAVLAFLAAAGYLARRVRKPLPEPEANVNLGELTGALFDPKPPAEEVGPFRIEKKIGAGGMADVFLAIDARNGGTVALKIPFERFTSDPQFKQRFLREGEIGKGLKHSGIVSIIESGEAGGRLYIAMELVEGETLKDVLHRLTTPLSPREAVQLALDVAEVLEYTHSKGVVHRDLKPDNILILKTSRRIKVADFGVAKQMDATSFTTTGQILGTPNYMPPEPFLDRPYDARSDLYSLGVLLFEALTLKKPFDAGSLLEIFRKHQVAERPRPSSVNPAVPETLDHIVVKLTCLLPEDRYPTASDLIRDLRAVLPGLDPIDGTRPMETPRKPESCS